MLLRAGATLVPRTLAEWLTALAWAAMLAGMAGCATSKHVVDVEQSKVHAVERSKIDVHEQQSTVQHVVDEGGTTTVYKFALPQEVPLTAAAQHQMGPSSAKGPAVPRRPLVYAADPPGLPWVLPPHGPLVEMAVTERGKKTSDTSTAAAVDAHQAGSKTVDGATNKKHDETSKMAPALSCALTGGLWALAVLAAIGGVLWLRFGKRG